MVLRSEKPSGYGIGLVLFSIVQLYRLHFSGVWFVVLWVVWTVRPQICMAISYHPNNVEGGGRRAEAPFDNSDLMVPCGGSCVITHGIC